MLRAHPTRSLRDGRISFGGYAVGPAGAHVEVDFRRHHDFVAVETELAHKPPGDLLARPHLIDVGRIEVVDAEVDCTLEERLGVLVVPRPQEHAVLLAGLAEAHHAEADA